MDVQWPELVFSEQFFNRINALAQRRFGTETIAEESVTYVINQLSEDNWHKCKKFTGKSKPETYLYSVSSNLIEEFSRKKFGRQRPPEWLKREGELWVTLWRQICLERNMLGSVIQKHCDSGLKEPGMIENIVAVIKAKLPWCGVKDMPVSMDQPMGEDHEGGLQDFISSGETLEGDINKTDLRQALALVATLISTEDNHQPDIDLAKWEKVQKEISLSDEDKIMLRLHFDEAMNFSAIARYLDVANHVPARQIKKALEKIAEALKNNNLHWDSLL